MSEDAGLEAVKSISSADTQKIESVMKRIPIKATTVNKMKRISSLFSEEMGDDVKEVDMIAFFLETSFDAYLKSGVIEERIKSLTE